MSTDNSARAISHAWKRATVRRSHAYAISMEQEMADHDARDVEELRAEAVRLEDSQLQELVDSLSAEMDRRHARTEEATS